MSVRLYLPELDPHFSALGQLVHVWNSAEFYMDCLVRSFVKSDKEAGDAIYLISSQLSNRDRLAILRQFQKQYDMGKPVSDRLDFIFTAFSTLNENRNVLVHSRFIYAGDMKRIAWARPVKGKASGALSLAPLSVLKKQVIAIEKLNDLMSDLSIIIPRRRENPKLRRKLPPKFALPRKLSPLSHEEIRSVPPLPPSKYRKTKHTQN